MDRGRLRQRQRALKPDRCQRRSVSGWTTRSTFLHVGVMAVSATSTIRSSRVTCGRTTDRSSTVSWCRSKAISVSNDRPERNRSTRAVASTVTTANMVREYSAVPSEFSADRRSSQDGRLRMWLRLKESRKKCTFRRHTYFACFTRSYVRVSIEYIFVASRAIDSIP